MNIHTDPPMTKEALLRWAERQEGRHEFVEGKIVRMTGASWGRVQIALLRRSPSFRKASAARLEDGLPPAFDPGVQPFLSLSRRREVTRKFFPSPRWGEVAREAGR